MLIFALVLSALGGLFFGLLFPALMTLIGIPMDSQDGLLSGLLFGLLVLPALLLLFRQQQRRFKAAMEKLPSPCTHSFSALLIQGKKSLPMAVFLCEDSLCLVDLDKKALPLTSYPCADIIRASSPAINQLEIHLTQDRRLLLRTGAGESLLQALKERNWLPFQH